MKIELWPVDKVRQYEKNPRKNDAAVDAVAVSIREFGWRQPIVVDVEGVIICGHTRLKAAQKLGLTEVPVHVAAELTAEQVKAYRLADNRTSDFADWDIDLLAGELKDIDFRAMPEFKFDELLSGIPVPPESFPEANEDIDTEHSCPKCGYKWSGKA